MNTRLNSSRVPCKELVDILLPIYRPCEGFSGPCETMRWSPKEGHIPRGFCGATGTLSEIDLMLIMAEPGDPHPTENYSSKVSPEEKLFAVADYAYSCYETGTDLFHRNVRAILDLFWPGMTFKEQMRKTWITESVLCSAKKEGGSIPARAWKNCRDTYLMRQLDTLSYRMAVALGSKARDRTQNYPDIVYAGAAAPPGCNFKGVKESWVEAAKVFRQRSGKTGVFGSGALGSVTPKNIGKKRDLVHSEGEEDMETTERLSMRKTPNELQQLVDTLMGNERKIVEKLGRIEIREGNKTYDLAFKALEKTRKPSFATFITNTHKKDGDWNRNEIPDSLVIQVRFRDIHDPDKTNIPMEWYVSGRWCDPEKGWFAFRVEDPSDDTIDRALMIVREAYGSL